MVKTITIKDEVYSLLLALKRKNESFSELFRRLIEKSKNSVEVLIKASEKLDLRLSRKEKERFLKEIGRERWGR